MFDLNDKVLKLFQDSDALLRGHFKLTSGKHSEWYFEKIRLIEKPAVMDKIIDLLVEKIRREVPDFDYVVSPAYGAIALGFLAALKLDKKFAFTQRVEEKMAFRAGFTGHRGRPGRHRRGHPDHRRLAQRGRGRPQGEEHRSGRDLRPGRPHRRRRPDRWPAGGKPPGAQGRGLRAGRLPLLQAGPAAHQARRLRQESLRMPPCGS